MSIKKLFKKNGMIRRIGKKVNIYHAYGMDAIGFSQSYLETAEKKRDYRYSVMLLVHSLEKGMCMSVPRPFGLDKVCELMKFLSQVEVEDQKCFEYNLGLSMLHAWLCFFEKHHWTGENSYKKVKEFLDGKDYSHVRVGTKEYNVFFEDLSENYGSVVFSRHSVRDFEEKKLDMGDVDFAIKCFIETPTACNRQMCGLIYVEDPKVKALLDDILIGLPGFNKKTTQYFIITYDLAAFAYSGERQQGLFNAGLCTTNFINGLHAKGIGSCCLQWSNKPSEDKKVRNALGLSNSERIGVVIGCGYYKEENNIPCSVRKQKDMVFKIV